MQKKYTDQIAKDALIDLSNLDCGVLSDYSYEIQDFGEFLLLQAQIKLGISAADLSALNKKIKLHFEKKLPMRLDDYGWMVVLLHGDFVIDSVLPDMT